MKTKLFILAGTMLAVFFTAVWAEKKSEPTWKEELVGVQTPTVSPTEDVSDLLLSFQGIPAEETAYLDDDKVIYASRPNDLHEKISRRKIAEGVEHVFDQRGSVVLYTKHNMAEPGDSGTYDLWISDTLTGREKKLSDSSFEAVVSPSKEYIAVRTGNNEIHLLTKDGGFLKKIGGNGAGPVFSSDGKLLAYYKLADPSSDPQALSNLVTLAENAQGVAVYNLETGKETLVTNDKSDYEPIAFSKDGRKLYFNSGRGQGEISDEPKGEPFQTPLWVVDIATKKLKQLNNRDKNGSIVFLHRGLLVSSDESTMVSSFGEKLISMLKLDTKGNIISSKIIASGTSPQWLRKDEVIAYRTQGAKGKYWEFVSIK